MGDKKWTCEHLCTEYTTYRRHFGQKFGPSCKLMYFSVRLRMTIYFLLWLCDPMTRPNLLTCVTHNLSVVVGVVWCRHRGSELVVLQRTSRSRRKRGSWNSPSGRRATSSTGRRSMICTSAANSRENAVHRRDDPVSSVWGDVGPERGEPGRTALSPVVGVEAIRETGGAGIDESAHLQRKRRQNDANLAITYTAFCSLCWKNLSIPGTDWVTETPTIPMVDEFWNVYYAWKDFWWVHKSRWKQQGFGKPVLCLPDQFKRSQIFDLCMQAAKMSPKSITEVSKIPPLVITDHDADWYHVVGLHKSPKWEKTRENLHRFRAQIF